MKKYTLALIFIVGAGSVHAQVVRGETFGVRDHSAFSGTSQTCLVQNPVAQPRQNKGFVPIRLPSKVRKEAEARAQAQQRKDRAAQQPLGVMLD
ncbi:MAG: hypothetical protein ABJN42_07890 [Roseibium sp.]|uniref:hypothetical protein n=1 Tax=Roseibium sp. TaxID=1936156 RepID=UPI003296867E